MPKVLEKSSAISLLTLRACVAYKKRENLPNIILMYFRSIWVSNLLSFPKDRMETKGLNEAARVFVEYREYIFFLASALEGGN